MAWQPITRDEYLTLATGAILGPTFSDPDGWFGTPCMLTTWHTADDQPLVRHQCWPIGHVTGFTRPCLYEGWTVSPRLSAFNLKILARMQSPNVDYREYPLMRPRHRCYPFSVNLTREATP